MRPFPRPAAVLLFLVVFFFGGSALPAAPQPPASPKAPDAVRLARLEHLARLWGGVRYFHPYLAYREIDWDQALLEALPRVRAAETPQAYAAAVQSMLARLGDPATAVLPRRLPPEPLQAPSGALPDKAAPLFRWEEGEVLVLDLRRADAFLSVYEQSAALTQEIAKARGLVVDVRSEPQKDALVDIRFGFDSLNRSLVHRTVRAPSERYLVHSGYAPQQGGTSGGYYSAFATRFAESYSPQKADTPRKRLVFLTRRGAQLPMSALALQAAGDATIVSEGEIGDETAALRRTYDLGEGFEAVVRLGEIQPMPGWPGVHADAVLPVPPAGDSEDVALRTALARPTVMLVDDSTISQAEHTGLFFEAAAGTVFIGTSTAGANGDVTNFSIPGGIRIGFTGHDVRHADGRQLQRVGLQPQVEVTPTIEGIRAGSDEVLERALRYLEETTPAP